MLSGYSSLSLSLTNRTAGSALPALAQKRATDVKVGRAHSGDQLEPFQPGQGSGTTTERTQAAFGASSQGPASLTPSSVTLGLHPANLIILTFHFHTFVKI